MKRILCLVCLFSSLTMTLPLAAQKLRVGNLMSMIRSDEPVRLDGNGDTCALIKFYGHGLENLKFASGYVIGDVDYDTADRSYSVYVARGIRRMEIRHDNYLPVTVEFRQDYGISIAEGATYRMDVMSMEKSKVQFYTLPRQGVLTVGESVDSIEVGKLTMNLVPGTYNYTFRSPYHQTKTGEFVVKEGEAVTRVPIKLKKNQAKVEFVCNVDYAQLYVDNQLLGTPGTKYVAQGVHRVSVVAKGYESFMSNSYEIASGQDKIEIDLDRLKNVACPLVVDVYGCYSPILYVDNKKVIGWENKVPIEVFMGKHLITVVDDNSYHSVRSKVVKVKPGMKEVKISFK